MTFIKPPRFRYRNPAEEGEEEERDVDVLSVEYEI